MRFVSLPGLVAFGEVFREVAALRPYSGPTMPGVPFMDYAEAYSAWERLLARLMLDAMETANEVATIVMPGPAAERVQIKAEVLRHVPVAPLACSVFDATDYRLRVWRDYDRARVFISEAAARKIIAAARAGTAGGRPEHPARSWYAERGFQRGGLSMKALQSAIANTLGCEPPSANTIRGWEKEAQKPPAKTP